MPIDKLPDDFEAIKPNIPACWSAQPISGGGSSGTQDVKVVNPSPISVSVNGTSNVKVTNTTSEPVNTKEVTT